MSEVRAARTFALLNMALHDAAVGCWDDEVLLLQPAPVASGSGAQVGHRSAEFPVVHVGALDLLGRGGRSAVLPLSRAERPSSSGRRKRPRSRVSTAAFTTGRTSRSGRPTASGLAATRSVSPEQTAPARLRGLSDTPNTPPDSPSSLNSHQERGPEKPARRASREDCDGLTSAPTVAWTSRSDLKVAIASASAPVVK